MTHLKTSWLIVLSLFAVPYALLIAAGSFWMYERGLLLWFLGLTGALMLAGWPLVRWLLARSRRRRAPAEASLEFEEVRPDPSWPPAAMEAWHDVDAIARLVQSEDLAVENPEIVWRVVYEVLDAVARRFHPRASAPALETPIPHLLGAVELVARDFRQAFSEKVPGSHILTLGDLARLKRLSDWAQRVHSIYRVLSFGLNPFSAVLREVRDRASSDMLAGSREGVRQWAIGFCVRKSGYYAIQLYSGQQICDDAAFRAFQPRGTVQDAARARLAADRLSEEPLRILVVGQVKAGKSSLVNALFGDVRAAVDVVPRTAGVEPYVLQRDGIPRAIVLDTAGYDDAESSASAFAGLKEHVLGCDLVLIVVSARSASRAADRRLLDELRGFFQRAPERIPPPIVAALTHVDELRPLTEWNPPYNLAAPADAKAANIQDAVRAVERDLALEPDQPVVPVCLKPERMYNVEEGLAPAILAAVPEAQRVKCLRVLRAFHDADYWQRLWRQALGAGRVLLRAGATWAGSKTGR